MSAEGETFRVTATIVQVLDQVREDLVPPRSESAIVVRYDLFGHEDIFFEEFLEIFDLDPEAIERMILVRIEAVKINLAMALMRKQRGDLANQLGDLLNQTFVNEDCCFDCVKRQLGLLPMEEGQGDLPEVI